MRIPRPYVVSAAVSALVMGGIGFLPLFGGPGYEHALATGLVVPTAAAIATSLDASRAHVDTTPSLDAAIGAPRSPLGSVGRGVLAGLAFAGIALLTALLHALRIGICELWGALLYFAIAPAVGAVLGGVWGAVAGELVAAGRRAGRIRRRRLVACLLALGGPLAGVIISVTRFYTSPMIFAFDPFVGFFSGTLYDTVIDAGTSLLTYRLGSLATLGAVALGASVIRRSGTTRSRFVATLDTPTERSRGALATVLAIASLGTIAFGTQLGHFSTSASIADELGAEKHGVRCDIVYPSTTREQEANLLVKDCDEQVAAVERFFGVNGPARIRAFFFRDAEEKKRLMGAAHTYIAKPWREEVYLQLGSYPHPVLGHELAHVIAGSFGRGPFRIAGNAGGLLPNPGLIEGVAVAASPDDDDLTDAQWARAMMEIGILPPMQRVFSLGFLGDASAKSYTLAGAFIGWLAETRGMEVVRRWYGGATAEDATGRSWPELEKDFRAYLRTVPLPPEAASFARGKFSRPGLFGRKCPHVVDALRQKADTCREAQRYDEALRLYDRVLAKDDTDFASRHARANVLRRHRDPARGTAELLALANDKEAPRTWRDRSQEAIADADFIDGAFESAASRYEDLAAHAVDEDIARTLEVKALGARDPDARDAVAGLLLGDAKHGPDIFVGGVALGDWLSRTRSPLAAYLVGRNLVQRGFFEKGAKALDSAMGADLPTPRIARETLRQRAIVACALSDTQALYLVKAKIEGSDDPFKNAGGGRRDATLRMVSRCLSHADSKRP